MVQALGHGSKRRATACWWFAGGKINISYNCLDRLPGDLATQ
jgi:hypothetical protein